MNRNEDSIDHDLAIWMKKDDTAHTGKVTIRVKASLLNYYDPDPGDVCNSDPNTWIINDDMNNDNIRPFNFAYLKTFDEINNVSHLVWLPFDLDMGTVGGSTDIRVYVYDL